MTKKLGKRTVAGTDDGTVQRTVVRTVERMDDGLLDDDPEASAQEIETQENIERIRAELGDSEGYVLLARRLPNGTLATLAKINSSIFDVEYIIKKFGGGTYSARFFKSGVAVNNGGFLGSVPFIIDPSVQPEPEPAPTSRASGDGTPSWLAASLDKMGDAIKALAERKPDPPPTLPTPPDPMAMIRAIGETMKALTPAPPPAPKELPAPPSFKEQLETIKSVIEVGTSIVEARGESGGGSGDAYMGVVSKLADPVIELVKTQAARERLRGPRRPALPAPAAGPVPDQPAAPAPAGGTPQMPWLMEVQRWLPLIQKRQQKGLSAESTAFFVLDELSDNTLAALAELAAQDGFEEQVKKLLPAEMAQAPEWVNEFLVAVKDYLFEDADTQPEDEGVIDLAEEAERRIGALKDKEEKPEQEQEPAP